MTKKNYQFYISMFCIFSLCFTGYSQANSADANLTVDSKLISKIWDKADHNSFPDLIRFNNEFIVHYEKPLIMYQVKMMGKLES